MNNWRIDNDVYLMNSPGDISISKYDKIYEVYEVSDIWIARWIQHIDNPWPNNFIDKILGNFTCCKEAKKFCENDLIGQISLFN